MIDLILDHPILSGLLVLILGAIVSLESKIGPRVAWPNRIRRRIWPLLHPVAAAVGRPLVREKDASEYVCSVACSRVDLQRALYAGGYRANLLSTLKYVAASSERTWERGSWAYRRPRRATYMHHCYFFRAAEAEVTDHLNHHREINYLHSPGGHMGGERIPGDPDGHLETALADADIDIERFDAPDYVD
ncbi:MAG: hypothetical protein ABEH64_13725 [Salinirussus sp.]